MNWFRNILKGVSLTAAMFVFQACYGTAHDDFAYSDPIAFRVVSDDGQPLPNVGIEVRPCEADSYSDYDWEYFGTTDSMGQQCGRCRDLGMPNEFRFIDKNFAYAIADTVITNFSDGDTFDIVLSKID